MSHHLFHSHLLFLNVCVQFSFLLIIHMVFLCVFVSRMITLKVLNSIVLLGTSCVFVKEANMEEKLFDPPPSAVSSRVNSRAHRTKHVNTAPPQGRKAHNLLISLFLNIKFLLIKLKLCIYLFSLLMNSSTLSQAEPTVDKAGISLASIIPQPADMAENAAPTIPKSDSDTFLTTPDEEEDDKIINADTGLEGDALKHRTPKKDLLEIDRFTICGNRIDWTPQKQAISVLATQQGSGIRRGSWEHAQSRLILVHLTPGVFINLLLTKPAKA